MQMRRLWAISAHIGQFKVNSTRIRQSRPDYGLGFQVKVLPIFSVVPFAVGSGKASLELVPALTLISYFDLFEKSKPNLSCKTQPRKSDKAGIVFFFITLDTLPVKSPWA
jgi:hypothetical protein